MKKRETSWLLLAGAALCLAACGEAGGSGSLRVRVSGEGAAKLGYPFVKNNATIAFIDGWQVRFSKFLVALSEIRLATFDGEEAPASPGTAVADLHLGDPQVVELSNLAARRWDRFGFKIVAPDAGARLLNQVAPEDLTRMVAGGFNYLIEGSATRGPDTYTFSWGMKNPTRNANCTNGIDGTDGFVVKNNTTTDAEITIHVDHMFWDTLGTEIAKLRFDPIAGASRDDKVVTFDELRAQALSDLRGPDGTALRDASGGLVTYDPGTARLPEPTLAAFILASAASQAHVNGTGLCTVSAL